MLRPKLVLLLAPALPFPAFAQIQEVRSVNTTVQGVLQDSFALALEAVGDIDGDGGNDFAVGSAFFGPTRAGKVELVSGATGQIIRTIHGSGREGLGRKIAGGGDVDADGVPDVAVSAAYARPYSVQVFSGASGARLLDLHGDLDGQGFSIDGEFGWSIAFVGDVNADGRDDVLVSAPYLMIPGQSAGRVQLFSGRNGAEIARWEGPPQHPLGRGVTGIGDRDQDGVPDFVFTASAPTGPVGRVVSGATLSVVANVSAGSGAGASSLGDRDSIGPLGDVDADGTNDFWIGALDEFFPAGRGRVYVYSGASLALLHTIHGEGAYYWIGQRGGHAGDVDGDGHDDLVFGQDVGELGLVPGRATFFSGRDGRPLGTMTAERRQTNLGFRVAALGDADGDGALDYAIAAPRDFPTGNVYLASLRDSSFPVPYCEPSGADPVVRLTYAGRPQVGTDFALLDAESPTPISGFFFLSPRPANVPFGSGLTRCVGAGAQRLDPLFASDISPGRFTLDFTQGPATAITPGSTWYFQLLFTRPTLGIGTTDGLAVPFFP